MMISPLRIAPFDRAHFARFAGVLDQAPLFHAAWMFATGITISHWFYLRSSFILIGLVPTCGLCVVAGFRTQRIKWLPLALLWCLLGAWCAQVELHPAPAPILASLSDGLIRTVNGTAIDAAPLRSESEQDADDSTGADAQNRFSQRVDLNVSDIEVVTDDIDAQQPTRGAVRLTIRWPTSAESVPAQQTTSLPFKCGAHLRAQVRLLPPETFHDPNVFSRADYLAEQGITSVATVNLDQVERLGDSPSSLACRISGWQRASTAHLMALPAAMRNLPASLRLMPDDAAMLSAMVTGDRTYLTHSLRAGFERTGSFHMLVVSGFHLAIVSGCILFVTRRMRMPRVPATLLTIGASFAYALFTGFATPVQRSFWMVTLYLVARLVYRERSPLNTIGFAALCLLAASPRSLFDAGLQMTLLAVVAIAGIAAPLLAGSLHPFVNATRDLKVLGIDAGVPPPIAQFRVTVRMFSDAVQRLVKSYLLPSINREFTTKEPSVETQLDLTPKLTRASPLMFSVRKATPIYCWRLIPFSIRYLLRGIELIAVSCVVELAMALPMALYFHRITVFALPVNLFSLPLLLLIMPAALITLIVALVWPAAAVVPAIFVAVPLHFGTWLVHVFGSLSLADFRISAPLLIQSLVFLALIAGTMVLAHSGRVQRRAAWAILLLAALTAVAPRLIEHPRNALLMEAIDVGQGDSILLITPEGKTLLIDAGGFGGGPHQAPQDFDIGEEVVSEALWSRGIRHLDAVALTHAHSDHMGGMPAVLRNFHPAELWVGNNPNFPAYNALLSQADTLHIHVRSLRAGDAVSIGSMQIIILAPLRDYHPAAEPTNDDSLVMRASYGATSVMLEGDAESPVEQAMLAEPNLQSTLLKVGHHGSVTSTRPEFLARVAPQWAVISCGLHNRYHHPRMEVLEALEAAKVRTYSTDITGAVCFELDGKSVSPDATCGWQQQP